MKHIYSKEICRYAKGDFNRIYRGLESVENLREACAAIFLLVGGVLSYRAYVRD
jgi:hypothetical protein